MEYKTLKSFPDYEIRRDGAVRKKKNKVIKSQYLSHNGYYMVSIRVGAKTYPQRVHRLIAEAFIPNPEAKPYINHIDGNRLNNCIENLEWCTQKENVHHAIRLGLCDNAGENNGMVKLNTKQVAEIKYYLLCGYTQQSIADKFCVSRSCVLGIKRRAIWRNVEPIAPVSLGADLFANEGNKPNRTLK